MRIPLSILGASVIIALGIYFGLRARPLPPPSAPVVASRQPPTVVVREVPVRPPERAEQSTPVLAPQTSKQAQIEAENAVDTTLVQQIASECYAPHANDPDLPAHLELVYDGAFDANGVEIARAISDVRGNVSVAVSQCARKLQLDLRIPPPGQPIHVNRTITVP